MEKTMPHNLDAERGVLGSIVLSSQALEQVVDFLKPPHFYREAHRLIYEAVLHLYHRREAIDCITLSDELARTNQLEQVGGFIALASLVEEVPTSSHIEHYAHIVERAAMHRDLIRAGATIVASGYEEQENAREQAERLVFEVGQGTIGQSVVSHVDALNTYWDTLETLHKDNSNGALTGVPTGYPRLNNLLGGWRKSKSYILAGRPGDGKTAFVLNFAYEAMKRGCQVLFFSIEMDEEELMQRLLAMESGVDSTHLRDGRIGTEPDAYGITEWDRIVSAMQRLQEMEGRIWIDATPANDIRAMRRVARHAQAEHGIDMIIVDYLQLAGSGNEDAKRFERRLEVEEVSRGLKLLARELKVPVLTLAQLNRDVENRANRKPQLSDLREAGGIEQDCDVAMFIYRDPNVPAEATEYDVDLLIEKHRNGAKGVVHFHYIGWQTRFYAREIQ